jgi:hypothetical protein
MSFCPLEQLRFNLDIELRPCHQTAQDTSVYAVGGRYAKTASSTYLASA